MSIVEEVVPKPLAPVLDEMKRLNKRISSLWKGGFGGFALIAVLVSVFGGINVSNSLEVIWFTLATLFCAYLVVWGGWCYNRFQKLDDRRQELWRESAVYNGNFVAKALMSMHGLKEVDFTNGELEAISAVIESWGVPSMGYTQSMFDEAATEYHGSTVKGSLKEDIRAGIERLKEQHLLVNTLGDVRLVGGNGGVRYFWAPKVNYVVLRDNACPLDFNPTLRELGVKQ